MVGYPKSAIEHFADKPVQMVAVEETTRRRRRKRGRGGGDEDDMT